jgi:hypothetical protein
MRTRHLYLLLGTLLAAGCSYPTSPNAFNGTWKEAFNFPGSSLTFNLVTSGNVISGSGTWSGEACCDGSVTIGGTEVGDSVSLDFAFVTHGSFPPPRTSHFTGRMTGRNTIVGTFGTDTTATDVVFFRTN